MPTIYNNAASITVVPRTRSWVLAKPSISSQWQYVPYLVPIQCVDVAAPEIGYADLKYDFGYIKREDSTQFFYYQPYQLLDWYVQIITQQDGYAPQQVWTGIITDEQIASDRPGFSSGDQILRAYTLAHLLDRGPIDFAYADAGDGLLQNIQHVPTFNRRSAIGFSLDGNRSSSEIGGTYVFSGDGEVWTNLDIANYLRLRHSPNDISVQLIGQADALADISDLWDFSGHTLWEALNRLIDRRRGLGFYPWSAADGYLYLWVFSLIDFDVQFGGATLPANPLQTFFEMPSARPWTHLVGQIPFRRTTVDTYDRIVARGQRAKVTGTFSFVDGNLTTGWSSSLESDYVTAAGTDPADNAKYRANDKFHGLFTRFVVPNDWDGANGSDGDSEGNLWIRPLLDGTFDLESGDGAFFPIDKTFLRDTPFKVGYDYTETPPSGSTPSGQEPDYQPMIAIALHYDEQDNTTYHHVDRIQESLTNGDNPSSCHVRPMDKVLGVELSVTPRHYFAKDIMDGGGDTNDEPDFNYDDNLIITATYESDVRQQIIFDRPFQHPSLKTLVIEVPGAEYWYVGKGTILDVDPDDPGQLLRISDENCVVRDDKAKLEGVITFAAAWYGVRRQAVQIPLKQVGLFVQIGTMITDIRNAYFSEPVRTVVTGRKIDFVAGTTVIETGYNALDVTQASNVDKKRRRKGRLG